MIRAFIAVALEPTVIDAITAARERLRREIPGVRWIAPANIHLTLKFLGNIDAAQIEPLAAALRRELHPFPRFTINAKGLGVFPGPGRPRVLWVGLTGDRLVPLASRIESALQPLGFSAENRKFTPHLTIGRWRESERAPKGLVRRLEAWKTYDFGVSNVECVRLMQSVLKSDGASYHELILFPLGHDPEAP